MARDPNFLTCIEFGRLAGFHRARVNALCLIYPGFAWRVGPHGWWKIPRPHLDRLLSGEAIEEIAAHPSMRNRLELSPKTSKWLAEGADAPA